MSNRIEVIASLGKDPHASILDAVEFPGGKLEWRYSEKLPTVVAVDHAGDQRIRLGTWESAAVIRGWCRSVRDWQQWPTHLDKPGNLQLRTWSWNEGESK